MKILFRDFLPIRKLGTAIITGLTAFHTVFRVDYGPHEHVFTGLQKWYNEKVDEMLLGGGATKNTQNQLQNIANKEELQNPINVSSVPKENQR